MHLIVIVYHLKKELKVLTFINLYQYFIIIFFEN